MLILDLNLQSMNGLLGSLRPSSRLGSSISMMVSEFRHVVEILIYAVVRTMVFCRK